MNFIKKRFPQPPSSEITPEAVYTSRRQFLKGVSVLSAAAALAACTPQRSPTGTPTTSATSVQSAAPSATQAPEEPLNSFEQITNFNNFYEFSLDKEAVAPRSQDFVTSPWQVEVGGLVQKPRTFGVEDILAEFDQEERIYRLRCVEGWSMVIPWQGFPLARLLQQVEPMSSARYVKFITLLDPEQMPGQRTPLFPWPYQEGLRLDEAMHDLTLVGTGLYGKPLPPQNGAPLRIIVPWKYGFKSIKSLVKIELVEEQPETLWNTVAPNEYGFYANVNPEVDHPRWSQASERRIGEGSRRPTLLFNGYGDQVASLYQGMDLTENY